MVADIEAVNKAVSHYVADVRNAMPIDRAFLFGSYAKGTATEYSDVDLCFFSHSFENKRSVDVVALLLGMAHKYANVFIEPHVFPTSELNNDNPFVKEILLTGREI
ncbi:MAG: nucleotidyltransferase domain-containing protein [Peptococcaceae bacterium]|jgi:predicted nucleotidyltransferase|nr:nucleotidyltransferase domain-containing protein [Peptococcaceae bacterium]